MHNFDFGCIFSTLCVVFRYDHTTDSANIINIQWILFCFPFLFSFVSPCSRARFHFISLYFENFIAECATKYSSSAKIYNLTSANRLQCPFIHIMLNCRHFSLPFVYFSPSLSAVSYCNDIQNRIKISCLVHGVNIGEENTL